LCDTCRRYLKTVDTRTADRSIYPPLEALTTLHLDMKAKDMGYEGTTKTAG
jgi:FdhE protein